MKNLTSQQVTTLLIGSGIAAFFTLIAIFGPWIAPGDAETMHFTHLKQGPSSEFLLGTDRFGRDVLSRLIICTRTTIVIAASSTALATVLGTAIGLISAYFGGRVDGVVMRLNDVFIAFPTLVFAMFVIGVLGPGIVNGILVIALIFTSSIARVVRSAALGVVILEYVDAARIRGETILFILCKEVLPNLYPTIIVEVCIRFGFAILVTASLSYIGLGPPPPMPDWGTMASEGRSLMLTNPWPVFAPCIAIVLLVVGINFLGDGLRVLLVARRTGHLGSTA
jgi:ABC-type dipeptide/oligopeptide/nickel transport system permease subunit